MNDFRNVLVALALVLSAGSPVASPAAEPLRVFATTPDLADLAREIGGDRVAVIAMVKGRDDPHFAEARPSFIKELSVSDLFVQVGLELELGYAPLLLQSARNAGVLPGGAGFLDASRAIAPLDVPGAGADRSMGDVHLSGSPHYLLDPVRGVEVAALMASKLSELRPGDAAFFAGRLGDFRSRVAASMVGAALAAKYDAFKLAQLAEQGGLDAFLRAQGDREALGGWFGAMLPLAGAKVVDDHAMWSYFARRFGVVVVGHLEPKPGIPPTTKHLGQVIERMKAEGVRAVFASPYYDPRHAQTVAAATGATVVELAHQTGARAGTETWLAMVDYNVKAAAAALGEGR